jgi:hypothetical protein
MNEPSFDRDGYPTEDTLTAIAAWPTDAPSLMLFVEGAWNTDYGSVRYDLRDEEAQVVNRRVGSSMVRFATGGWSGNESVIHALRQNIRGRLLWLLSTHGGLHIYRRDIDG